MPGSQTIKRKRKTLGARLDLDLDLTYGALGWERRRGQERRITVVKSKHLEPDSTTYQLWDTMLVTYSKCRVPLLYKRDTMDAVGRVLRGLAQSLKRSILVSWGCSTNPHKHGVLKQQQFIFSEFWRPTGRNGHTGGPSSH